MDVQYKADSDVTDRIFTGAFYNRTISLLL